MRAYFYDSTGDLLEFIEYDKLTSAIFKSMCTEAMDYLKSAMTTDDGKRYGSVCRWIIGDWRLECYSFGEDWFTSLALRHSGSKSCELRCHF